MSCGKCSGCDCHWEKEYKKVSAEFESFLNSLTKNQGTAWICKSLEDDSPSGVIHSYNGYSDNVVCGKALENESGMWYIGNATTKVTCKKCIKKLNEKGG